MKKLFDCKKTSNNGMEINSSIPSTNMVWAFFMRDVLKQIQPDYTGSPKVDGQNVLYVNRLVDTETEIGDGQPDESKTQKYKGHLYLIDGSKTPTCKTNSGTIFVPDGHEFYLDLLSGHLARPDQTYELRRSLDEYNNLEYDVVIDCLKKLFQALNLCDTNGIIVASDIRKRTIESMVDLGLPESLSSIPFGNIPKHLNSSYNTFQNQIRLEFLRLADQYLLIKDKKLDSEQRTCVGIEMSAAYLSIKRSVLSVQD